MTAGIQIWGDHGFVQIDQNARGMVLVMHGDVATAAGQFNGGTFTYNGVHGRQPLVCVRVTGPHAVIPAVRETSTPGVFTVSFYVDAGNLNRPGTISPGEAHWYLYDLPDVLPSSRFGFEIYRDDGKLCFDATRPYMRVVGKAGAYSWTMNPNHTVPTQTLQSSFEPAGKKYAVWTTFAPIAVFAGASSGGSSVILDMWMGGTRVDTTTNTLLTGLCWYASTGSGGNINSSYGGSYMLLDVTGHDKF